jgi:ribosome-binding factor A
MSSFRLQKVNSLLRKEISQILLKEIDFGDSLVTITDVKTIPNLTEAKISITVIPTRPNPTPFSPKEGKLNGLDEKEREALSILKRNIYDIQKIIDKKFKIRPVPKIHFEIDEGVKNLYRIDKLSNESRDVKK